MIRISIEPTTFEILDMQHGQNPYIDIKHRVDKAKVARQHKAVETAFDHMVTYRLPHTTEKLPDIVFVANGGLALPRLPVPLVILPWMKYPQRRAEGPYLDAMFAKLGIATHPFPGSREAPFEGAAELKWFHGGQLAVCGPGWRSTRETFRRLRALLKEIYEEYGLEGPDLLVLPLISDNYYHLDVAMLEFDDDKCVIHKRAFSPASIRALQKALGPSNVTVLDTTDSFCLNAVVDGRRLITHKLTDPAVRPILERATGRRVHEVDTSEFERSGGSVRCMTLDIPLGSLQI
jgi:N-dimethylarginine dimethylaminohydrolase